MAKKEIFQEITKNTFHQACDAYMKRKELNSCLKEIDPNAREVNLHEAISETMVCYALDFKRNSGKAGDATDKDGNLIEIKATSKHDDDLSSFSPDTKFNKLFFLRLDPEKDIAEIYDMQKDHISFGELKVNKTQTVSDQQDEGKRPRLSLVKEIEKQGLKPCCVIDIAKKTIKKS